MAEFNKILIANRGEIAIRVMRAANELGKKTVAVFAEEDKLSLHRFKADEAYRIGEGMGPVAAYLSIEEIIRVARMCGADAIHPGYGLLSENPDFVDACTEAGIKFIGPPPEVLDSLGDKTAARALAIAAQVPVIPGTQEPLANAQQAAVFAAEIGYPVMIKAAFGGGGRGTTAGSRSARSPRAARGRDSRKPGSCMRSCHAYQLGSAISSAPRFLKYDSLLMRFMRFATIQW